MNCESKNQNHNFFAFLATPNSQPMICCSYCGEIRPLELPKGQIATGGSK